MIWASGRDRSCASIAERPQLTVMPIPASWARGISSSSGRNRFSPGTAA